MKSSLRLDEPSQIRAQTAANDNDNTRGHRSPVLDRAKSNRLFSSPAENLLAVRTINRMDEILASAESDPTYTRAEESHFARPTRRDAGDELGGPTIKEVKGRSAERVIEDMLNGPVTCHDHNDYQPPFDAPIHIHGRFKFNVDGIITGYRLNRTKHSDDRDVWVSKSHPLYPDNRATPRDAKHRDPRGTVPGKTYARDMITPANDNFDARSCVTWIKARMAPEHYEAVYDVTAGLGFNEIGVAAGFSGKQADAVGKDRVICGLRQIGRLLAEWDDGQVHQ